MASYSMGVVISLKVTIVWRSVLSLTLQRKKSLSKYLQLVCVRQMQNALVELLITGVSE